MDISEAIHALLRRKSRAFMTLVQIRDGLPMDVIRQLGLKKRVSSSAEILKRLKPMMGSSLKLYKAPRSWYIGFNHPIERLILSSVETHPGQSSKRLRNRLPVTNSNFVNALNNLLKSGAIQCELDEKTHAPKALTLVDQTLHHSNERESMEEDCATFKKAYESVAKEQRFIRVHRIRERLNWSVARFDGVLLELRKRHAVQLQGGDPSLLTAPEIENSFLDEKGRLRIIVTWIDND